MYKNNILFKIFLGIPLLFNISGKTYMSVEKRNNIVLNSINDASMRGFTLDNKWVYESDIDKNQLSIDGTSYHYGYMDSWMGIYKYYDSYTNEMFVLLLSSVEAKPRQDNYWDQKRFNNQMIKTEFISSNDYVHYLNYAPRESVGTIETVTSITVTGSFTGEEIGLSVEVSYEETYSSSEISVTSEGTTESGIAVKFNFLRYNTNTSTDNVHCSNVTKGSYAIFRINNYNPNNYYYFTIRNYVSMYRYGLFNSSTVTEQQEQMFII